MKLTVAILVSPDSDADFGDIFKDEMFEVKKYKLITKQTSSHRLSHSSYYRAQIRNVLVDISSSDNSYVLIIPGTAEINLTAKSVIHRIRRLMDAGYDISHPFDDYSLLLSKKSQRIILDEKEKIGIHAILSKYIAQGILTGGEPDTSSSSYLVKPNTDYHSVEERADPIAFYWYIITIVLSMIILYFLSWVI